ncbi:MAG: hypothetical protein FJY58_10210 [Betaproteobacteria bacterium]|nr:hypothetical protein [Betaproteobacteria bacterium]
MWATIGKCLTEDSMRTFIELIDQFVLSLAPKRGLSRNWSGHLNLSAGELSNKIILELEENLVLQQVQGFFNIDIKNYEVIVGINLNLPGSQAQHPHMDGLFHSEHYILNIPLVDTSVENGAIQIFPKTHLSDLSYSHFLFGGYMFSGVRVEAKAGFGLLRSSRVWHRGMPNNTRQLRPMLSIVFHESKSSEGEMIRAAKSKLRAGPVRLSSTQWFYPGSSIVRDCQHFLYVKIPLLHGAVRILKSCAFKNSNF